MRTKNTTRVSFEETPNMENAPSTSNNFVRPKIEALWEKLPTHKRVIAKTRNGEDIYGTYIKAPDLLRRLQDVYGLNYEIHLSPQVVYTKDNDAALYVVLCSITVMLDDGTQTTVSDMGSAPLLINNRLNENAAKSAATDAFKRAVRWLGIGMFQYDNDEPELIRNSETQKQSSGSSKTQNRRKTERNFAEEYYELTVLQSERVQRAVETAFELGLADPDQDDEAIFQKLTERFNVSPKQLLWLLKDEKTGREWIAAFEKGESPKVFLERLFASSKQR